MKNFSFAKLTMRAKVVITVLLFALSSITTGALVNAFNRQSNNQFSPIYWNSSYQIAPFVNGSVPTAAQIKQQLAQDFPVAFADLAALTVSEITKNSCKVSSASSRYPTKATTIKYDANQIRFISDDTAGDNITLSAWFDQNNQPLPLSSVTDQMILTKLLTERSNSLNINHVVISKNNAANQVVITPKSNSVVYNATAVTNAIIDASSSTVLRYNVTVLDQTTLSSGLPNFTYHGAVVTPTYQISGPYYLNIVTFNETTGELKLTPGEYFNGGLYVVTGTYALAEKTYTATWCFLVRGYYQPSTVTPLTGTGDAAGVNGTYYEFAETSRTINFVSIGTGYIYKWAFALILGYLGPNSSATIHLNFNRGFSIVPIVISRNVDGTTFTVKGKVGQLVQDGLTLANSYLAFHPTYNQLFLYFHFDAFSALTSTLNINLSISGPSIISQTPFATDDITTYTPTSANSVSFSAIQI